MPPAWLIILLALVVAAAIVATVVALAATRRGVHRWLTPQLVRAGRRAARASSDRPIHLLLAICDHYEPGHGQVAPEQALRRVERWVTEYPRLFSRFRDADGRPPRHSFFYPLEMYVEAEMNGIVELCRHGFGEIEVHLHHDNDTSAHLRQQLTDYVQLLSTRHGLLSRDKRTGAIRYGFIHGNWALDNARPDGRWCGVNDELDVLRQTGCYCDFTMPSAPAPGQTRKINSIYYATDDPRAPKSHDDARLIADIGRGPQPPNSLMLIQGPLLLNWRRRKWGVLPRLENADIHGSQPPTMQRLDLWLRARVQAPARPDWFFVKLHTHGAPERNAAMLLGEPMTHFHESLARRAAEDANFHFHYVTARELYNLARAAERGWTGPVAEARDHELRWPA